VPVDFDIYLIYTSILWLPICIMRTFKQEEVFLYQWLININGQSRVSNMSGKRIHDRHFHCDPSFNFKQLGLLDNLHLFCGRLLLLPLNHLNLRGMILIARL
jgi:hypothetical protein